MLIIMKLISLFAILLLGCNHSNNRFDSFHSLINNSTTSKAIIISCIHCNCIINDLNSLIVKKDPLIKEFIFYGDTACLKDLLIKDKIIYISQAKLDSISTDFYNMLIYNKNRYGNVFKMVKTEESYNLRSY